MAQRLTNTGIQSFLQDFKENSRTQIYESGKQKDEIIAIAKAKMGIDLKNNSDLAGFKTIYTFADKFNGNGSRLPKQLLLKALPTLIGKPVNINHVRNYVVGYYIDYCYVEAKDQVVAYGLFFKSNFGEEWAEAKNLLKSNQLGTSHEVWSPEKTRKYFADGTYESTVIEFAGGALIYRGQPDPLMPGRKMHTAHRGCDVLELAMQHMDKKPGDMLFASLEDSKKIYNKEDLIVASEAEEFVERIKEDIQQRVDSGSYKENNSPQQVPKVICEHCKYEFETLEVGEITCQECKSIIDRTGKVLFPPQVIDFNFNDPDDGYANWRLIENSNESAIIKNTDTGKIYELNFKMSDSNDEILNKISFVYIGSASCPQCGYTQSISTSSKDENFELNCPRCELRFHKNIKRDGLRKQITNYIDITEDFKNRTTKKVVKEQMTDQITELDVASLPTENKMELEVASLIKKEEVICNLEVANLQETEVSLDLEIANQVSTVVLETASLNNVEVTNVNQIERYKSFIKKIVNKVRKLRKEANLDTASLKSANTLEIAKIQEKADTKIEFYKTNAVELVKRRDVLGEFGSELSNEKIMDDNAYALAKSEKDNALLKASLNSGIEVIGDKPSIHGDNSELKRLSDEITKKAFK